ncbi:MAG: Inner rane transport protein YajR [Pseudomonadota bacterium]|jgi:MFS family permease
MTPQERRTSAAMALVYALRMLGLFLVLPVFAIEARAYPGGDDPALLGLAMGMYGLTQALLQLPYGMASDRLGRKRVIVAGLLIFALGSFWAASAQDLMGLLIGRSLQGAGAVSAAVTALLADLTRETVRTKAMALVGASIGLVFALSLVLAPWLTHWVGLHGLFVLTGVLALGGIAVVIWGTPAPPPPQPTQRGRLWEVLRHPALLRLNVGVFVLHAVQLAMWVALPGMLQSAGVPVAQHWQVYLPTVLLSFVMLGGVMALERRGRLRLAFLGAIAMFGLVQLGLLQQSLGQPGLVHMVLGLLAFFCAFNALEAVVPSLSSRLAPAHARGTALGVYNTLQSFGLFAGGWAGGAVVKQWGTPMLFLVCALAVLIWLLVAWPMPVPGRHTPLPEAPGATA